MEILDNESARLLFNEPLNSVEVYWKGHIKSDKYKGIMQTAYDTIIKYEATQWLSDMTHAGVTSPEYQQWVKNEFIPKCAETGLKRVAVVLAKDVFARFYVDKVKASLGENDLLNERFKTREEAHEWLELGVKQN